MLLEIAGVGVSAIGVLNDLVTRYQDVTKWGEVDLLADDKWCKLARANGTLPAGDYVWSRPEKVAGRELDGTHSVVMACNAEKRLKYRICRKDGTVLMLSLSRASLVGWGHRGFTGQDHCAADGASRPGNTKRGVAPESGVRPGGAG